MQDPIERPKMIQSLKRQEFLSEKETHSAFYGTFQWMIL